MNTFLLEGPGGIPGIKQVPQGFSVLTNKPFVFLGGVSGSTPVVDQKAAATLTAAQSGTTFLLDAAAGFTLTLPTDAAGLWFRFVTITKVTSNSYKVITASGSSFIQGALHVPVAAGTDKVFYGDGATHLSVNLTSGTNTSGDLIASDWTITCLKSGLWQASGTLAGSGTVVTPFATS